MRNLVLAVVVSSGASVAAAQTPVPQLPTPPAETPPAPPPPKYPAQFELNTINLPTTMSLGRHKSYFRLTHRFARDITRGDFGDLAADLFSLDNGAIIGVEYRFGVFSNLQAGVHRSILNKTIVFFGRYDPIKQKEGMPVSISTTVSGEGLDNFRNRRQTGLSATVSHTFGDRLAFYATPAYVFGTHEADLIAGHEGHLPGDEHANHHDTSYIGLGSRLRFSPGGYLVGEYTPRLSGYDPNSDSWGVAIEKRTSGHTLQLNFGNTFATTPGQLARGGNEGQVYMGFNITRKF